MDDTHGLLSGVHDNTTSHEAFRLIDEAIERHQGSPSIQLALKSQRNTFAPISRLPTEILCRIFSIVKNNEPLAPHRIGGIIRLIWVKLTHVSRSWRDVGIGSSNLWTDLPLKDVPWVERMLIRSKGRGLVISGHISPDPFQTCSTLGLKLALQHSQRAKVLSVLISGPQHWPELQEAFPKTAPQLEYLLLTCELDGLSHLESDLRPSLSGSKEVLCETPKLRRLELTNFQLNWNRHLHLLHALTHLKLHNVNPPDSQLTWKQFADLLKGMPDLEVLDLDHSLPTDAGEPVPLAATHFAFLRTLFIHCRAVQVQNFLSCITFPPTTTLRIKCFEPSGDHSRTDFSGALSQLAQLYSNMLHKSFETLVLLSSPHPTLSGLKFRLFKNAFNDDQFLTHDDISAPLELMLEWKLGWEEAENTEKAMNDVFSCGLPLLDISCLYLPEMMYGLKPKTLAHTVGKLGQLRYIRTSNNTGGFLVVALQSGLHNRFQTPYFPVLSDIHFHGSRFRAPYKGEIEDDDPTYLPAELLYNCLFHRTKSGARRLLKLKFTRCRRMLKRDVVLFGNLVNYVDWDGLRH